MKGTFFKVTVIKCDHGDEKIAMFSKKKRIKIDRHDKEQKNKWKKTKLLMERVSSVIKYIDHRECIHFTSIDIRNFHTIT